MLHVCLKSSIKDRETFLNSTRTDLTVNINLKTLPDWSSKKFSQPLHIPLIHKYFQYIFIWERTGKQCKKSLLFSFNWIQQHSNSHRAVAGRDGDTTASKCQEL